MTALSKPINNTATGAALWLTSSVMTGKNGASSSCALAIRMSVLFQKIISKGTSGSLKGKAEQLELNSLVLLCFRQARLIMRQKRRKPQPETTVHKDMAREEFARQIAPCVGRHLRDALEHAKQLQRERSGDE